MQLTKTRCASALAVAMSFAVLPVNAQFSFTKIADTNTPIPGGTGNFTGFQASPSLEAGNVAFLGFGASGQVGFYTNVAGALNVAANKNTPIPGGTGNFTFLAGRPSLDGTSVAFIGKGTSGQNGIYTDSGGSLTAVADTNTPIPGAGENFSDFPAWPWLDAGDVVFRGDGVSGLQGVYTRISGSLNVVADTNTPIPGGTGNFTSIRSAPGASLTIQAGSVTFRASGASGQTGFYTDLGGSLHAVADANTAIPGGTGNFTNFGSMNLDAGNFAFRGFGAGGQQGIYSDIGGLSVVADKNTPIPGGTGTFTVLRLPDIDGSNVAFTGFGAGQKGLYVDFDGSLLKILDLTDTLDGKAIVGLDMEREAFDGNQLTFFVEFADSSQAIYVTTVPEPATMSLFTLAAVALTRKRKRSGV